ncbi:MAG: protein kinase [Actinobacteria bacterium]|nr:protein kinase [Actinomycetota bacterium]
MADRSPSLRSAGAVATVHSDAEPAPLATDLRSGTVLAGYRLEEIAGRGGMGVVYRAQHLHLERTVALKLLSPDAATDAAFRARFTRESRTAAALQHPNIVTVYDAGERDGLLYIAMQYIDGTTLDALLRQEGALKPEHALSIAAQIGSALDAAHERGILHRDVKPANVLLDERGAYLGDFGLTKGVTSEAGLTSHGQLVGTIDYMPPEQIEGARVTVGSDIYAFACVLYHALAGGPPFQRDSHVSLMFAHLKDEPPPISTRQPGLPEALDPVFAQSLAKRCADRHESCSQLVMAARGALGLNGTQSPARPVPRTPTRTILIASAERGLRAAVRGMLGARRFGFGEAESGEAALAAVRESLPDVLLLDWSLPGLPAAEVCRLLGTDRRTADVKVLLVAPRTGTPDELRRGEIGAGEVLLRPFSSLQLRLSVAALLASDPR